mmetsp:Transcript_89653/g.254162  ORF Transcript_89653/g.254162 Transcript_89653/m.254162 type:complete len:202 (-) Transcript_89653:224-829(-)
MPPPMFGMATSENASGDPAACARARLAQKRKRFAASMGLPCQNQGMTTNSTCCIGIGFSLFLWTLKVSPTSRPFAVDPHVSLAASNMAFTKALPPRSQTSRPMPLYGIRFGDIGMITASCSRKTSPCTTSMDPNGSKSIPPSEPAYVGASAASGGTSSSSSDGCLMISGLPKIRLISSSRLCSLGSMSTAREGLGGFSCRR